MSILLTTPQAHDPGHGGAIVSYPEVKIVQVDHEIVSKRLVLHMQYGETIAGDWIGALDMDRGLEVIENDQGTPDGEGGWLEEPDPAYDLFMISQFAESLTAYLYDENARALYEHLIDGPYPGAET